VTQWMEVCMPMVRGHGYGPGGFFILFIRLPNLSRVLSLFSWPCILAYIPNLVLYTLSSSHNKLCIVRLVG
jgi:hypothetical protein